MNENKNNTLFKKFDLETFKKILKNKNVLFVIGILGILLVFVSDFKPSQAEKNQPVENIDFCNQYVKELETKLETILVTVAGAGQVQVMVTVESSEKYVYAQAEKSNTDYIAKDSENTTEKSTYQNDYIIVENDNGNKTALTETTLQPEIKGVAVVCTGADSLSVQKDITEMVSIVLGIPSNRVCVIKMT